MSELPRHAISTYSMTREPIPRSVVLAAWLNSWIDGSCSVDDITMAMDVFGPQRVSDPSTDSTTPTGLIVGLAKYGIRGNAQLPPLRAVLPTAGDPTGLPGPPAFNQEAIAFGQVVIADARGCALIPIVDGSDTTWVAHQIPRGSSPATLIRPEQAEQAVRSALLEATTELADLDLANGRDQIAEELRELHLQMKRVNLPPSLPPTARHTIHTAGQILGICELALVASPPVATASLDRKRVAVLTQLATTARHCLAVAVSAR